jgi:predicted DsbA family dithiol-disulfide isomerase
MTMRIDFISDITCPWCAIGLAALEQAIARANGSEPVELHIQPFELNPDMPAGGETIAAYVARKYGITAEQLQQRQALIRARGAEVGFRFGERTRIWNTFDAHRLLHWAGLEGRARELKHALLAAYHTRGEDPSSHEVLVRVAGEIGLDRERAGQVLADNSYADEVRQQIDQWQALGIQAVPTVIFDRRFVVQGGQPVEVFERALREASSQRAVT